MAGRQIVRDDLFQRLPSLSQKNYFIKVTSVAPRLSVPPKAGDIHVCYSKGSFFFLFAIIWQSFQSLEGFGDNVKVLHSIES
jgi:hypothetical protein